MASKRRLSVPGAIHYIFAKSIKESQLFSDSKDQLTFLKLLGKGLDLTGFKCLKWEFNEYWYKLILKINNLPLSALMRPLNSAYALYFNKRHGREGHLFNKRFKSLVLQDCYTDKLLSILSAHKPQHSSDSICLDDAASFDFDQMECSFSDVLEKINSETQNRHDPQCWSMGKNDFLRTVMSDLQKENHVVANYTLSNWSLLKLRNFILEKMDVSVDDFYCRGRSNKLSNARKLFSFFAVRVLEFRVADVGRFLKISGPAVSKLSKKGAIIAKEINFFLPQNYPENSFEAA